MYLTMIYNDTKFQTCNRSTKSKTRFQQLKKCFSINALERYMYLKKKKKKKKKKNKKKKKQKKTELHLKVVLWFLTAADQHLFKCLYFQNRKIQSLFRLASCNKIIIYK